MVENKIIGYLHFKFAKFSPTGKTEIWYVKHKDDDTELGVIKWDGGWRQYVHHPASQTKFSRGCYKSINTFIDELMNRHNAKKNKGKKYMS